MADAYNFIPLNYVSPPEDEQLVRSREFLEVMSTRRTVRDFDTRSFPIEIIENAIKSASTAPSGANQQPWTFVVISNPEIKRKIREAAEAEEKESYQRRMSQEWLKVLEPLGTNWHKPHLEDAPYLIVVFKQAYGYDDQGNKVKHYYVDESVGIAVGLLIASLHLAGIGTLTHTPNPMRFLSEICGRPDNERAMMILVTGYPREDAKVPDIQKKSLDDVMVHLS